VTALERQLARCAADEVGVVLATAHAAKFHREVDPLLDRPVEIPARLARHRQAELRARRLEPTLGALADALA
ncbi:MAG: threonine synthase, partial [Acidobacteriota bacterium]